VNETAANAPVTVAPSSGDDTVRVNADASGSATALFNSTQRIGQLQVSTGGTATLTAGAGKVLTVTSVVHSGTGRLDLTDNDLIVDYAMTSPLATIQSLIAAARNGGAWNGSGITSTAAASANPRNTTLGVMGSADYRTIYGNTASFSGRSIDATAVLVKYTYYGDANFSGRVTFDDYVRLDSGFNQRLAGWSNGDFDGNGAINFDDYVLIDTTFNTQAGTL
jgi:hypothetical protein